MHKLSSPSNCAGAPHTRFHLLLLTLVLTSLLNLAFAAPVPYTPRHDALPPEAFQYPPGYDPLSEQWQYKYDPKWLESLNWNQYDHIHVPVNEPLAYIPADGDLDTAMPQLWTLAQNLMRYVVQEKNKQIELDKWNRRVQELQAALERKQRGEESEEEEESESGSEEVEEVVEEKPKNQFMNNGVPLQVDEYGRWLTGINLKNVDLEQP